MKKLMLSFAAVAAFVSVASAEDAWFAGTIGGETGGSWTMIPGDGEITTNTTTLVLEDAAASFAATTPKAADSSQNLKFATSANFKYSYDTLPAVDQSAKAGIVVYTNEYYVLAKDDTTNNWTATGIAATSLNSEVAVNVTISNDNSKVIAIYNIAGSVITKEVVAGDSAWGAVDYKGSGEVASLVGTTISLGWPLPGGGSIAVDPAWAAANGISQEAFASTEKLSNGFSASESYILGLNTNEAFVASLGSPDGDKFMLAKPNVKAEDKVSFDVYIDGEKKDGATLPYECFTRSGVGTNERTIELRPQVVGQVTTGKSQTIGVWATAMINSNGVDYVNVPYECSVASFLWNLSNEGHTDYMDVYDAASGNWDRWQVINNSTTWEYVPANNRETPITTVLKPGQAVKVTVGECKFGDKKCFYRVGTKVDRAKTAVVPNVFNLVGSPDGAEVSLANFATTDKIRAFDRIAADANYHALPDVSYTKYGAKWYKIPLNGAGAVVTTIDSGVHGFFVYTDSEEIDWSSQAE